MEYSITVNNADTDAAVGSAKYTNGEDAAKPAVTTTNDLQAVENALSAYDKAEYVSPAEIVNTTLASLPSTGGAGTIALTIGASLGMGAFLTVYIVNKKKAKGEA